MLPSQLIEKEENWLRNCLSQTKDGKMCATNDPDAVKFCAGGAIMHYAVGRCKLGGDLLNLADEVLMTMGFAYPCIVHYNNDGKNSHRDVVTLLQRVEERAIEKGLINPEEACSPAN